MADGVRTVPHRIILWQDHYQIHGQQRPCLEKTGGCTPSTQGRKQKSTPYRHSFSPLFASKRYTPIFPKIVFRTGSAAWKIPEKGERSVCYPLSSARAVMPPGFHRMVILQQKSGRNVTRPSSRLTMTLALVSCHTA